jgi:hypothetical protein
MVKRTSFVSFLVLLVLGGCGSDEDSSGVNASSTGGAAGNTSTKTGGAGGATNVNAGGVGVIGGTAGLAGMMPHAGTSGANTLAGASGNSTIAGASGAVVNAGTAGITANPAGATTMAGVAGATGVCSGCIIAGLCYPEGSVNPGNPCQWCASASSKLAWSNHDGAVCDDGLFCTGADSCSAGQCTVHAGSGCDDKVACNGVETCNETAKRCAAGTSTCTAGQVCDITTNACVAACAGCTVAGVCYPDGVANPTNACQWCATASSKTAWSNHDGAACDDGLFCTGADSCSAGQCSVHAGSGCDDKIGCNGVETCNETTKRCVAGTSTCTGTQVCDIASNSCVGGCTGCKIGGVCYPDGVVNPSNSCQWCSVAASATAWSNHNGASCNDGNFCNGADTCQAGVCTATSTDPCTSGQVCLESKKQCCTPGTEATRTCNSNGDVTRTDTCGQTMAVEPCTHAASHGACSGGTCGCTEGYSGNNCGTCVIYADAAAANDTKDGKTWANAKKTLQAAINAAAAASTTPANRCQVWVKAGTYKPSASTTTRATTITLSNGVTVYGGFTGTEISPAQRNWKTNVTILSGDIDGDNALDAQNSYHVVTGVTGATLDGFTITMGYASDGSGANSVGGAMYNSGASPTVTNCTFSNNSAIGGGAMYNETNSSPTVTNCTFSGNGSAITTHGGAMYNGSGSPASVTGCTFSGNTATSGGAIYNACPSVVSTSTFSGNAATNGGAIYNDGVFTQQVSDCVFSGNGSSASNTYGGAIYNKGASPKVINCTFFANTAKAGSGTYSISGSQPEIDSSILWGIVAGTEIIIDSASTSTVNYSDVQLSASTSTGYAGVGSIHTDPIFVSTGATNIDYLHLSGNSPCIDLAGTDDKYIPTDILGNAIYDVSGVGCASGTASCSSRDMGAYEYRP